MIRPNDGMNRRMKKKRLMDGSLDREVVCFGSGGDKDELPWVGSEVMGQANSRLV
jgi:hypothetical protein